MYTHEEMINRLNIARDNIRTKYISEGLEMWLNCRGISLQELLDEQERLRKEFMIRWYGGIPERH